MATHVVLGVRLVPNKYERVKLENIDLEGKVENLRENASQKINKNKEELEFVYGGVIMEDQCTLSSYGVKPGVTVHVLKKLLPPTKAVRHVDDPDVKQMIATIEDFRYKNMLQKVARPEVMDKIIAKTPSLVDDPAAIALLRDPELVALFVEAATLRKALQTHPVLIDALANIVSYMKENPATLTQTGASTSTGYSYSLDALSDDDDMDSNESPREANPLTRNSSYNAITAAQLAAAIASATTNFSSTGAIINNPAPAASPAQGSVITSEMFGSALQQAFASQGNQGSQGTVSAANATNNRSGEETMDAIKARLRPQLEQMREMGLTNESVNILALQATSGDVQAAVELVFNH